MFDYERISEILTRVRDLREPELVLLNGHLLVERMMTEIAAVRMTCAPSEVPRLTFRSLIQVAFRDDAAAKSVLWLNELRNLIAHRYDALESEQFTDVVKRFGLDWPVERLDRAVVIELILYDVQKVLYRRMSDEIEHPWDDEILSDWDSDQHDELGTAADQMEQLVTAAKDLIANGRRDAVINILKPGWRHPRSS